MCLENESDLLSHWFLDIGKKSNMYNEPMLGEKTVKFFKQICDTFEQNTHVFIMSVEVAENYLRTKKSKNEKIADPLLAAVTISFICHKCEGALESLKVKHIVDLLFQLSKKSYSARQVLGMEGDILITLNGIIQMTTVLDDMDVIIEKYMSESRLKGSIRPLCLKILEYVYFERKKWFQQLKEIYSQNKECMNVFQHLISSKFYVPVSVLITAIELTHYRHVLDVDTVLADVTKHTKIHEDHVRLFAAKIIEVIKC
ncbi:hypothetical protein TcasGA2_TC002173 [Tribolium castaneum]|uniref:Cyclin N-terminal domain-containing protein n=2 Tax=Tribolium castaneum TaxID=7070 RepID=D6WY95_TRICA|nr:hypothetical protein TcasGA2_TC002173 [Tribolium castaneum]